MKRQVFLCFLLLLLGTQLFAQPSTMQTITTAWGNYVNTGISGQGITMLQVTISGQSGGNYVLWHGMFSVQGNNSYTPNPAWNNIKLISYSGYSGAGADDVQALIMSNTSALSYGNTTIVLKSATPITGAATMSVVATGSNASSLSLTSQSTAPFTYPIVSSAGTYNAWTVNGSTGIGTYSPLEKFHLASGKFYIQNDYLGAYTTSAGPLIRIGDWNNSLWTAGLGITQGEGVDVIDLDFYSAYKTPNLQMKLTSRGNLGIGTANPLQRLHVNGNIALADNSYINGSNGFTKFLTASNAAQPLKAGGLTISDDYIDTAPLNGLFVKGNVGIGTTNPGPYKMAVEGTLGVRKLKVTQVSPWADYVFEPTYKLPSLEEIEAFIKEHKHLPDVPSAKEVEKEGIDVGDNQAVLLKKIEELTLYVIELKKEVNQLKKATGTY